MKPNPKRYLITSALPYANGLKHIGHLAGAYIPADIYVRYLRSQKRDVVFVCGSDEHGTAIPIQAMKEGTTGCPNSNKICPNSDKIYLTIFTCSSSLGFFLFLMPSATHLSLPILCIRGLPSFGFPP
jgi:leucyl-tRNA synthetase